MYGVLLGLSFQPEEKYQSVALLQHHSCHAVAPHWCYPLSLALRHWRARVSNPGGDGEGRTRHSKADQTLNTSDLSNEERAFLLPQALPLNCSSPHFHRFIAKLPRILQISHCFLLLFTIFWGGGFKVGNFKTQSQTTNLIKTLQQK